MAIERQNRIQSGRHDVIHRLFNVLKIPSAARLVQADIKGFWKESNFEPPLCFDPR